MFFTLWPVNIPFPWGYDVLKYWPTSFPLIVPPGYMIIFWKGENEW